MPGGQFGTAQIQKKGSETVLEEGNSASKQSTNKQEEEETREICLKNTDNTADEQTSLKKNIAVIIQEIAHFNLISFIEYC